MPKDKQTAHAIKAVEIFAPGRWNGMDFVTADLDGIVAAFKALGDLIKVPLKLGHNEEQQVTDGQPALGWVDDVWVEPKGEDGKPKLMARFVDLPKVMLDAITKKLFRTISIELVMDAKHGGKTYDNVLTAVAILGADMPAVNTLADLTAFMSRNPLAGDVVFGRVATFTAIGADSSNANGSPNMDELEKAQKRAAELEADNLKLKGENAEFKTTQEANTKAADALKITNHRAVLTGLFDKAVEDKKILPAQRETFIKVFALDDDVRVMGVTEDQVKGLIESTEQSFKKGAGVGSGDETDKELGDQDPGDFLDQKTHEAIGVNPKLTYAAAQQIVFKANPKTARQYHGFGEDV